MDISGWTVPLLAVLHPPGELGHVEEGEVLQQGQGYEEHAVLDPEEEGADKARAWDGAGHRVAHVVHHQEEGDQETKPARNCFYLDNKTDPTDDNHQTTGNEIRGDENTGLSRHDQEKS